MRRTILMLVLVLAAPVTAFAARVDENPGDKLAQSIAQQLCYAEAKATGMPAFVKKYGSGDAGKQACLQAYAVKAQAIVQSALAACKSLPKSQFTACVGQKVQAAVSAAAASFTGPTSSAGSVPQEVVAKVATALCYVEGRQLGKDGFQKKYGTGDAGLKACVSAHLSQAAQLVQQAVGACAPKDTACIGKALQALLAKLNP